MLAAAFRPRVSLTVASRPRCLVVCAAKKKVQLRNKRPPVKSAPAPASAPSKPSGNKNMGDGKPANTTLDARSLDQAIHVMQQAKALVMKSNGTSHKPSSQKPTHNGAPSKTAAKNEAQQKHKEQTKVAVKKEAAEEAPKKQEQAKKEAPTTLRPKVKDPQTGGQRLLQAAKRGDWTQMSHLLEGGAAADVAGGEGEVALHWAAAWGEASAVRALVLAGADVRVVDKFGETPLIMAARWGNLEAAKALVELGAHVSAVSRNTGKNAEEEAALGGHDNVAKYLPPAQEEARPQGQDRGQVGSPKG